MAKKKETDVMKQKIYMWEIYRNDWRRYRARKAAEAKAKKEAKAK